MLQMTVVHLNGIHMLYYAQMFCGTEVSWLASDLLCLYANMDNAEWLKSKYIMLNDYIL